MGKEPKEGDTKIAVDDEQDTCHKKYINGYWQNHREDGPAVVSRDGEIRMWYINGKEHREDGPAVETESSNHWYRNGIEHREDGPAITSSDGKTEEWIYNGVYHRLDGPARINRNIGVEDFIVKGRRLTRKEFMSTYGSKLGRILYD